MTKRQKYSFIRRRRRNRGKIVSPKQPIVAYLLEQGTLQSMRQAKDRMAADLKYYWNYYSELARQRNQIQDDLKKVLIQDSISNFSFEKWQRSVKWKYGLHPLSTLGSLTFIGGRFNTGQDVNSEVPSFPALYLAIDKDTSLQEMLAQEDIKNKNLSAREIALMNPQSEVTVSISGELEKVFDLREADNLKNFVELLKEFKLSTALIESAKFLEIEKPKIVKGAQELMDTLLDDNWRSAPAVLDVPANSQIFGHLIYQAGIEGILYPSQFTKKDCLAIFPHNFAVTSSYIALDDEPPHEKVPRKVDSSNWRICDLSPKELIEGSPI